MFSNSLASAVAMLTSCCLLTPSIAPAQEAGQANGTPQKYKLTIIEGASTSKRPKKGRVSSQAVVKLTDSNNIPVPGITVTFLLPQAGTSGAAFGNGALSAVVTTNSAGVASSGPISATAGSSFSVSVAAAVPGAVLTATVPISTAAVAAGAAGAAGGAAAGAGISTGVIVGIAAAVVAGVVVAAVVLKGKSSSSTTTTPPVIPTVSAPCSTCIVFGGPK